MSHGYFGSYHDTAVTLRNNNFDRGFNSQSDENVTLSDNLFDYGAGVSDSHDVAVQNVVVGSLYISTDSDVTLSDKYADYYVDIAKSSNITARNVTALKVNAVGVHNLTFSDTDLGKANPLRLRPPVSKSSGTASQVHVSDVLFPSGTVVDVTSNASAVPASLAAATLVSVAALQAELAGLRAQMAALLAGVCPAAPGAGRRLLAPQPVDCIGYGGATQTQPIVLNQAPAQNTDTPMTQGSIATPPAGAAIATATVNASLALSGIDLATFSGTAVASAVATFLSVSAAAVRVTVTDLQVDSAFTFVLPGGAAALTTAQQAALRASVLATLPPGTMVQLLGVGGATGRRLLGSAGVSVSVSNHGANASAAGATRAALTDGTNLAAHAAAVGAASATAAPPVVTVRLSVVVAAASQQAAAVLTTSLGAGSTGGLAAALAAQGVATTGVVVTIDTTTSQLPATATFRIQSAAPARPLTHAVAALAAVVLVAAL